MSKYFRVGLAALLMLGAPLAVVAQSRSPIQLPTPQLDSNHSIESAIHNRRTVRSIAHSQITLSDLGQLLWAAQGITSSRGLRTAPSAGALYPLELYVLVGNVEGLTPGLYHYQPAPHQLVLRSQGDLRAELSQIAVNQSWVARNAAVITVCAVMSRTTQKYGDRGERYVYMEVGHAAQNVLLQALSRGLVAGVVGAFRDRALDALLKLPRGERALYLIPVGKAQT